MRGVTLKDIARETGFHVSTVSRALDPRARSALTDEVVQKVSMAAERMGYRPNRLASGLRTKRTKTVGLVIPDITNPLFPPIVRGVESVLEPLGYVSIIVNTDSRRDRERSQVGVLLERGVDGIIHAAVEREDPFFEELRRQKVPVVTVNRALDAEGIPAVVSDDAEGIRAMVRLLTNAGHTRIAHIAGPQQLSTGVERHAAFREAVKEFGLKIPEYHIIRSDRLIESEGRRCTEALLSLVERPTAILAANDRLALGAIEAINQMGLSCPGDVSVTGFNDSEVLRLIPPGLTTVRVDKAGVGKRSAELLIRMIESPEEETDPRTVLPIEVVERGSVAPPPKD
ncbi:LacI family DNA-binding transcriptional regulator [Histidinibacterium aquaticum]|uniref:LacI family transcriptional regulator n=1 Tax=Histidinibacterium aquaticum TaxID=2613962 RepID=A0A5J5GEV5_9RHOB|nr:LacI family DNA-binding transcriptional regulator [Histidinibacterium aquaticum]KAA9006759.1 LacI family transcriptional regulator [Histidinibacterium aquaticum]